MVRGERMIRVLELFSGYGGASFALSKAGLEHRCVGYSDIEGCANYIFALNHGEDIPRLGDVTKIDPNNLEDFDLLTGGFPCQSFSIAGKREGFAAKDKGNLFFEIIRIASVKQPRWLLLENVQGLLSHDNGETMKVILRELKKIGYFVNWKLLFSKEHGTPQNRPRVWFACFKEKSDYDQFMFPETEPLKLTVKDLLEDKVDEKYYLNKNQLDKINNYNKNNEDKGRGFKIEPVNDVCTTITSHAHKDNNSVPLIADFRYDEGLRVRKDGVCPTLKSRKREVDLSGCPMVNVNRWRRLTPRECFRLQGFFNDEINFGNLSDSKLYFLAGNGWDVNVASKIFVQMFVGNMNEQKNLSLFTK